MEPFALVDQEHSEQQDMSRKRLGQVGMGHLKGMNHQAGKAQKSMNHRAGTGQKGMSCQKGTGQKDMAASCLLESVCDVGCVQACCPKLARRRDDLEEGRASWGSHKANWSDAWYRCRGGCPWSDCWSALTQVVASSWSWTLSVASLGHVRPCEPRASLREDSSWRTTTWGLGRTAARWAKAAARGSSTGAGGRTKKGTVGGVGACSWTGWRRTKLC